MHYQSSFLLKSSLFSGVSQLFFLVSLSAASVSTEMREWTNASGSKAMAKLVGLTETHAELVTAKGKKVTIRINTLARSDIDFLSKLREEARASEQVAQPKQSEKELELKPDESVEPKEKVVVQANQGGGKFLPLLQDGKGQGYFAYYEGEKFVAKVTRNGEMMVTYKQVHEDMKSWSLHGFAHAFDTKKVTHYRGVLSAKSENTPALQPDKIAITKKVKGGFTFDVVYEFDKDSITFWFKSTEDSGAPQGLQHSFIYRFGATSKVDYDKNFYKKMKLKSRPFSGKRLSVDFDEQVNMGRDTPKLEISGPLFQKESLVFNRGRADNGMLIPANYADDPLKGGFWVCLRKQNNKSDDFKGEKVSFEFR